MVEKFISAFSIYRHVNQRQRQRRRDRFVVRDSPSPSPDPSQDINQFTQLVPTLMAHPISNATEVPKAKICGDQLRSVPTSNLLATKPSPPKPMPSKASIASLRQAKGVPSKSKTFPASRFSSPSEADEAPPVEEVHPGSGLVRITSDALRIEGSPKEIKNEPSETSHSTTAAPNEVYGYEHRTFFMHTKRSLRGRTTSDVNYSGAKMHVAHSDKYYELCDTDTLFASDEEGRARKPLKTRHNRKSNIALCTEAPSNREETPAARPRTRSMAPRSSNSDIAMPDIAPQSDADNQRYFAQWTEQLIKKQAQLGEKISAADKQIDELRTIISIKDEDIDKLQARLRDLRRKKQNDTQVVALRAEVAALEAQLAAANSHAQEQKERFNSQSTQLKAVYRTKTEEGDRLKKQIHDLETQIRGFRPEASAAFTPNRPFSMHNQRSYISPLSRAIGRDVSTITAPISPIAPPQADPGHLALVDAAKAVVMQGAALLKGFGEVSAALAKLKEVLEEYEAK